MPIDVTTRIEIARPREVVSGFAADPGNAPKWYTNIKSVEWLTEPAVRVGARIAFVAHFLGRKISYTYEITEFVPAERLVMGTAEGPFPMKTTYTWDDAAGGNTRMALRNTGQPSGFSRLASLVMVPAMRRANRKDLALLKSILEES